MNPVHVQWLLLIHLLGFDKFISVSDYTYAHLVPRVYVLHLVCWVTEVRHAKLSSWSLVVCGTARHPYQPLAATAARRKHLQSNEVQPSYAVYPHNIQQRPHFRPSADYRAVYQGPCQKPTAHYGSTLTKSGNKGGKTVTVGKHEALQCLLSSDVGNFSLFWCRAAV